VIVPSRSPLTLSRIVARIAKLSPPRHRELMRGMVAELDSISDPAERTLFALGAVAAIARLTLKAYSRPTFQAPGRFVGFREPEHDAGRGGPTMSKLTTRQLLRRHITPFAVSFASLTVLLLASHAVRQVPQLSARGAPAGAIAEVLLLAVPFTMALTIPMAVFLAVSWVFTRLGAEGVLAAARQERHGVRRLIAPVLGAAAVIATLTLVSNTQVVPRANARLAAVLAGAPRELTDRTMTVGELREAARMARAATGAEAISRAVAYEVEIQKKLALAAACMILALAGAATAIRFPRGGVGLVLGSSGFVFTGYYLSLVAGEVLADRQVIPPFVAMWMANAFLLGLVLLLAWRPSHPDPRGEAETLAIGG
jgi:lipopolysaccharide export LptBFGC system permease protein LptF